MLGQVVLEGVNKMGKHLVISVVGLAIWVLTVLLIYNGVYNKILLCFLLLSVFLQSGYINNLYQ